MSRATKQDYQIFDSVFSIIINDLMSGNKTNMKQKRDLGKRYGTEHSLNIDKIFMKLLKVHRN